MPDRNLDLRLVADASFVLVVVRGRIDQNTALFLNHPPNTAIYPLSLHPPLLILTALNYLNIGGLRCLVTARKKANAQQQDLWLCGLNDRLQEIFAIVGFDQLFRIFPDMETARQAYQARSG
ncbi:MAG: STAS domain-containing protein [Anaerolineales bacterium]|nr:STAS domain-containing protein [Anaerolineales bacterium]